MGQDQAREKAPAMLRVARTGRRSGGLDLADLGDLTARPWQPDPGTPKNLEAALATFDEIAEWVAQIRQGGRRPLRIGGECTVELGVLAGHLAAGVDPALLYLDGGVTSTPWPTTRLAGSTA